MTALPDQLLAYSASTLDETLSRLARLMELDAPTGDRETLRATEELLGRWLADLGADVREHPSSAGTHLEARFASAEGGIPVLVAAHYDTVWARGTCDLRPLRLENGVAHGPGTFDMRGGLVASIRAVQALSELGALRRSVTVLLTADEESGSATSADLLVELGTAAGVTLIPEPPLSGGRIKTARKGVFAYRLEITGREAHAGGGPERGISAVHELAGLIRRIERLARPDLGTTVNVGVIGGGTRPNVVAGSAFAEVDVRAEAVDEARRVEEALDRLTVHESASLRVSRLHARPPMQRTAAIARVAQEARRVAGLLGIDLEEGAAGGASDGNLLAPHGVAVVDGLGPEGGGAHALDEHVLVSSLEQRVALMAMLIARL